MHRLPSEVTMEEDQDQEQFFKDLSATVEQTVDEVHAVEENYFYVLQKTTSGFPLVSDLNRKLQSYAEQYVRAGLEFAHKLSQAKNFQDFARIQMEFIQAQLQSFGEQTKDFVETYTKAAASAVRLPIDQKS